MKSCRQWMIGLAVMAACAPAAAAAQDVEAGVRAWEASNYAEAVRQWRPAAERGNVDALFNLGHAYRLGRGVAQNMQTAEQHYERAARGGHVEAQAMYGVMLFQNGRRREAMPWLERGAMAGDPRAQYLYGTALFNGDLVARDWPRAYAMMTRAAAQGLPPAASQLQNMEQHLTPADRQRGVQIAAQIERGGATPPPRPAQRPPVVTAERPARPAPIVTEPRPGPTQARPAPAQARPAPTPNRPAPAPAAAPSGWRVQLGAFSSPDNARRHWAEVSGRGGALSGLQPFLVRAGAVTRLQAGPLANRAAAERACGAVRSGGGACFVVAP
jgi:cell division septation protein DedD